MCTGVLGSVSIQPQNACHPSGDLVIPRWLSGKNSTGDTRDVDSISVSGRFLGGEDGNPLQYSCLENLMDRGAWRAMGSMGSQDSDTTE